ncbi:hypothetical protein AB0F44_09400 [Nocardioides sp. NPDC023903]|uniref:hypothetical protein n=1 Tax=Nocardioides sp. NPDC023903 TaxID=3157195 RepID=UPI0033C6C77F
MTSPAMTTPALTNRQRLARSYKAWGVAALLSLVTVLPVYLAVTSSGIELSRLMSVPVMVVVGLIGPVVGAYLSMRSGLGRFCTGAAFVIIATPMTSLPLLAIPAYVLAPWIAVAISEEPVPQRRNG